MQSMYDTFNRDSVFTTGNNPDHRRFLRMERWVMRWNLARPACRLGRISATSGYGWDRNRKLIQATYTNGGTASCTAVEKIMSTREWSTRDYFWADCVRMYSRPSTPESGSRTSTTPMYYILNGGQNRSADDDKSRQRVAMETARYEHRYIKANWNDVKWNRVVHIMIWTCGLDACCTTRRAGGNGWMHSTRAPTLSIHGNIRVSFGAIKCNLLFTDRRTV